MIFRYLLPFTARNYFCLWRTIEYRMNLGFLFSCVCLASQLGYFPLQMVVYNFATYTFDRPIKTRNIRAASTHKPCRYIYRYFIMRSQSILIWAYTVGMAADSGRFSNQISCYLNAVYHIIYIFFFLYTFNNVIYGTEYTLLRIQI